MATEAKHAQYVLSRYQKNSSAYNKMNEKKPRKPNWSDAEMEVLVNAYCGFVKIIRGKLSPVLTVDMKKKAWENIAEKVNSVALACKRTVEETRKRFQDSQSVVKKKEAYRKKEVSKTGGGPMPEVSFKPWEVALLSTIPKEAIHGLEGAADTGTDIDKNQRKNSCKDDDVAGPMGDCNVTSEQVSEYVVDVIPDLADDPKECPASEKCKRSKESSRGSKQKVEENGNGIEELLNLKRQRLELEERKVKALEKIASVLETRQSIQCSSDFSLSPVIKFT